MSLYLFFETHTSFLSLKIISNCQRNKPGFLTATLQWSCFEPTPPTISNNFKQLLHIALSNAHAICLFDKLQAVSLPVFWGNKGTNAWVHLIAVPNSPVEISAQGVYFEEPYKSGKPSETASYPHLWILEPINSTYFSNSDPPISKVMSFLMVLALSCHWSCLAVVV